MPYFLPQNASFPGWVFLSTPLEHLSLWLQYQQWSWSWPSLLWPSIKSMKHNRPPLVPILPIPTWKHIVGPRFDIPQISSSSRLLTEIFYAISQKFWRIILLSTRSGGTLMKASHLMPPHFFLLKPCVRILRQPDQFYMSRRPPYGRRPCATDYSPPSWPLWMS